MNAELIYHNAALIHKEYRYSDCSDLAEQLGIKLYYRKDFDKLLGFYTIIESQPCIFINARLENKTLQMVLAHEIGHDRLHKDFAINSVIGEHSLFDSKNRMEYEANAFAAHLLISTSQLEDYLKEGASINETASEFNVDINLILIKLLEMKKLGSELDLTRIPQMPKGNFLKSISF